MDFGQPNVEIGRKMANGQLLFLALYIIHHCIYCLMWMGEMVLTAHVHTYVLCTL